MRLLLVEDDRELAESLVGELRAEGFAVDHAANGIDGEFMGDEVAYDVVVLDLGLPHRSGLDVLRHWRTGGNFVPVLVLSARDAWQDRVDGLKSGADDYLGKPFHREELVARIVALVRRAASCPGRRVEVRGLSLDEDLQQIRLEDGRSVELTATEFRFLRYFMLNRGKILPKSRLMEHVFDQDFSGGGNLIEVYVKRLREKIGKERIRTLRGQGYLFVAEP